MDTVEVALVAEAGPLEQQAILLVKSLRDLGGRLSDATVTVASPRPARRPSDETVRRLHDLGADYVPLDISSGCPLYGTSWRLHSMAALEQRSSADVFVQLDSDTLFVDEVDLLPGGAQVAARAVDVQGMTTAGPDDANHAYWAALCALAGTDLERLPWVTTSVDHVRVRASHNGGFVAARRELGLFTRTSEVFTRSVETDLRPRKGRGEDIRSATGQVGLDGSEWWGSAQAALSVAAASLDLDVTLLPDSVNVPLHSWYDGLVPPSELRHVHYHWLLEPEFLHRNPLLNGDLEHPVTEWLSASGAVPAA